MEEKKKRPEWLTLIGLLVLVLALMLGVKIVFGMLETAIPPIDSSGDSSSVVVDPFEFGEQQGEGEQQGPKFCIHCGEGLPEHFAWGQYCPQCGKKME